MRCMQLHNPLSPKSKGGCSELDSLTEHEPRTRAVNKLIAIYVRNDLAVRAIPVHSPPSTPLLHSANLTFARPQNLSGTRFLRLSTCLVCGREVMPGSHGRRADLSNIRGLNTLQQYFGQIYLAKIRQSNWQCI